MKEWEKPEVKTVEMSETAGGANDGMDAAGAMGRMTAAS